MAKKPENSPKLPKDSVAKQTASSDISPAGIAISGSIEKVVEHLSEKGDVIKTLNAHHDAIMKCIGKDTATVSLAAHMQSINKQIIGIVDNIILTNDILRNIAIGLFGKNVGENIFAIDASKTKLKDTFLNEFAFGVLSDNVDRVVGSEGSGVSGKTEGNGKGKGNKDNTYTIYLNGQLDTESLKYVAEICNTGGLKNPEDLDIDKIITTVADLFQAFEDNKDVFEEFKKFKGIDQPEVDKVEKIAKLLKPINEICEEYQQFSGAYDAFGKRGAKSWIKVIDQLQTIIGHIDKTLKIPEGITTTLSNAKQIITDMTIILAVASVVPLIAVTGMLGMWFLRLTVKSFNKLIQGIAKIKAEDLEKQSKTLFSLMKIVLMCSGILFIASVVGGLVLHNMKAVLAFLGVLLVFTMGIFGVIALASLMMKGLQAIKIGQELSMLILTLTGCLIIGAIFMMIPGLWKYSLLFGLILSLYLTVILGAMALATVLTKGRSMKVSKELVLLVAVLTMSMIIGAAVLYIPGMTGKILLFGSILTLYVTAILGALALMSKIAGGKAMAIGKEFVMLISVMTACIIAGAAVMLIPNITKNMFMFLGVMTAYIVAIGGLAALLAWVGPYITPGIPILYMIESVIGLFAIVVLMSAKAIKKMKDLGDVKGCLDPFKWYLKELVNVFTSKEALLLMIPGTTLMAMKLCTIVGKFSKMISKVASSIMEWSSMTIPMYDAKGVFKGYKRMTDQDKLNAVTNIKSVLTLLGNTILDIGKDHPDWFKGNIFTGGTPFSKIIESMQGIGSVISDIAQGVKDYASLIIPQYNMTTGKITGYRKFTKEDFKNAAEHIGEFMVCIARAMTDTYLQNPDLFEGKAMKKMTKASANYASILSSIAEIIDALNNKFGQDFGGVWKAMGNLSDFVGSPKGIFNILFGAFYETNAPSVVKNAVSGIVNKVAGTNLSTDKTGVKLREQFDPGNIRNMKRSMRLYAEVMENIAKIAESLKVFGDDFKPQSALENLRAFISGDSSVFAIIFDAFFGGNEATAGDKIKNKISGLINGKLGTDLSTDRTHAKLKAEFEGSNIKDMFDAAKKYVKLTEQLAELAKNINKIDNTDAKGLDTVIKGMTNAAGFMDAVSNEAITKMGEGTSHLNNLVTSVNSIEIEKANKMLELVDALNSLNLKIDNVDEVVEILNTSLAETLIDLSDKIKNASKIIEKADKLQDKRNSIIQKSIKDINTAMSKTLMVNVAMDTSSGGSVGEGGEFGNAATGNTDNIRVSSMTKTQLANAISQGIELSTPIKISSR